MADSKILGIFGPGGRAELHDPTTPDKITLREPCAAVVEPSTPESRVKALKESGAQMSLFDKILFVRCTTGLGLCEAVNSLKVGANYFEGPWHELKMKNT